MRENTETSRGGIGFLGGTDLRLGFLPEGSAMEKRNEVWKMQERCDEKKMN